MVGFYREYAFEVRFRKHQVDEAWFAEVSILRPDKSHVGVFQSPAASRDLNAAKENAKNFVRLMVDRDLAKRKVLPQ